MVKFKLKRIAYTRDGVLGVLFRDGAPVVLTTEPPWLNNVAWKSCIPAGKYTLKRGEYVSSHGKKYESFMYTKVPGRTRIWIHIGNDPIVDSDGCQLIATGFILKEYMSNGKLYQKLYGLDSTDAHKRFMDALIDENEIEIEIIADKRFEQPLLLTPKNVKRHLKQEIELKEVESEPVVTHVEKSFNWLSKTVLWWQKSRNDIGDFISMVGNIVLLKNPVVGGILSAVGSFISKGEIKGTVPAKKKQ